MMLCIQQYKFYAKSLYLDVRQYGYIVKFN